MNSNDYLFYPGKTPLHPRGKLKHFTKRNNKKSDVEFIKQVPQNPLRCSVRKDVLRNFTKFTGKHLCQSLFFNKVASLRPVFLSIL